MNADRLALSVAFLLLVATVPMAAAQTLEEQAGEAAARGERILQEAEEDPEQAANASWQAEQVNWTTSWTCGTAYAADERAGEAAADALGCTLPRSEQAGEDEEDQAKAEEEQARAEEAEADAERAARDQAAATEAFVEDVEEEPEQTPSHAQRFLNRTLAILEDLPTLPLTGARLAGSGMASAAGAIGQGASDLASGLADGTKAAGERSIDTVQSGLSVVQQGTRASADAVVSGAHASLERIEAGVHVLKSSLGVGGEPEPASAEGGLAADETVAEETEILGEVDIEAG